MLNWIKNILNYRFIPHDTMTREEYDGHVTNNKVTQNGLESLTKKELLEYAKFKNVKVKSSMNKATLIKTITSSQKQLSSTAEQQFLVESAYALMY